jgi:hypothetical protein
MDEGDGMTPCRIEKLGTITCDLVESTPVVYDGRLLRFEYVRNKYYSPNTSGDSYFRFVDVRSGRYSPGFARGFHLGCAHVEGNVVYAYGTREWNGSELHVFRSDDLEHWTSELAIRMPGWGFYNSSVCKGPNRYIMAIEAGKPLEIVGVPFTIFFAESDDLIHWRMMGTDHIFDPTRYTACPTLRHHGDQFYMTYLEAVGVPSGQDVGNAQRYETHITRTRDFIHWEQSPLNPILSPSDADRHPLNPDLSPEHRRRIAAAVNNNNSDMDFCEFNGEVVIYYSWGNQHGVEHLAQARCAGPLGRFLESFFPSDSRGS